MLSALHFMVFKSQLSENFLIQYVCMTKDVLFSFIFFFPFPFLKRMVSKCNVKKSSIETIHAFSEYKIFKQKC